MRRFARVDDNQKEIVNRFRAYGASVQSIATIGRGCPDLLIGYRGFNGLVEIKDGNKEQSAQKLTVDEKQWHLLWRGNVKIINSVTQVQEYLKWLTESVR